MFTFYIRRYVSFFHFEALFYIYVYMFYRRYCNHVTSAKIVNSWTIHQNFEIPDMHLSLLSISFSPFLSRQRCHVTRQKKTGNVIFLKSLSRASIFVTQSFKNGCFSQTDLNIFRMTVRRRNSNQRRPKVTPQFGVDFPEVK